MKKLSRFIEEIRPAELARLRGMRANDSSRDKRSLLKRIIELEEALKNKGEILIMTDFDYIIAVGANTSTQFGRYKLKVSHDSEKLYFWSANEIWKVPNNVKDLNKKIADYYKGKRYDEWGKRLPNDDIIALIEQYKSS